MNESRKLLIGFAVVGGLCCCIFVAAFFILREVGNRTESMIEGDPTSIAKMQGKIAEFDIPPGYSPMAMNMFIYDMITLTPDTSPNNGPMIMLMQYNGIVSGNAAQIEEQLKQAAEQQGNQSGASMHFVESFDQEIRGETVTVTVSEGEFEDFTMRQWMAVFKGNRGPTLLMIQGPVESWDETIIEDFINSIQ